MRNLIRTSKYRYFNRSLRFAGMYREGLSGEQAVWANKKYQSHRMIPAGPVGDIPGVKEDL
jgi:hypothetical protein